MYLNCHSWFSFKYGTLSPASLLQEAQKHGVKKLALTDINNTSGILDFFRRSEILNIKAVAGIDFRNNNNQKFICLAKNADGFCEMNDFLSMHLENNSRFDDSSPAFKNCFTVYPFNNSKYDLNENEFIGIKPGEIIRLQTTQKKIRKDRLVILSPVTFRNRTDFNSHRLLRAMSKNTLLSKLNPDDQGDPEDIMKSEIHLENWFRDYTSMIENTKMILDYCNLNFDFGRIKNKRYFTGSAKEDDALLQKLCMENLNYRYPNADDKIIDRYEKEIKVIINQGFASYFLINYDIVSYARHRNYFYVGRGSGANSMVAYLLRITDVDPVDLDLYFERFLNPFRTSPPDFDIDFSWKDRDDIISYIFKKHGKTHTALLATYSTLQDNAVIRELGKVFGLPKEEIDQLQLEEIGSHSGQIPSLIKKYSILLNDFPSHLNIHAGGILISEKPIHYYTATSSPPKGFPLTQFSMIEAEDVGLYKFDILSQRGLGHIKDGIEIIKKNKGVEIDIHDIKRFKNDEKIKTLLREAKCMGCFYVESPAMRMLLKKLGADSYLGLVAASSIIRPGVASSGMMREYILRSKGLQPVLETPQSVYDLLKETFGVMVYQEDVIKVAHYFAGLTLGEADMLRRGMSGKYRGREEFKAVKEKFFSNCRERKYSDHTVHEVWRQIESFAGYAFSKGHSASYAVESYQSLFLKAYFPLEHMVAVINNFGGFYRTEYYIHEARMAGAKINAPDINNSDYTTCIYGDEIFLGLIHIAELETHVAENILNERIRNGNYLSLENFMKRVSISVEQLRLLIRIGAFRFTYKSKKELLWDIHKIIGSEKKTVVTMELFEVSKSEYKLPILDENPTDDTFDEKELLGFTLDSPFHLLKAPLATKISASDFGMNKGKIIEIAGYLVTTKQTRTKNNQRMMFGTFIDIQGEFFDTTHFPNVYDQYPIRGKGCYLIKGKVAEEFGFYSLDVISIKMLDNIQRQIN